MFFQGATGDVTFSIAALCAMGSGFGGIAVGWGMYRQAIKDLTSRMDKKDLSDEQRDKNITLLTTNIAALSTVSASQTTQLARLGDIIDRMATYPRGGSSGTWQTGEVPVPRG